MFTAHFCEAVEVPSLAEMCGKLIGNQIVKDQSANVAKTANFLIKLNNQRLDILGYLSILQSVFNNAKIRYKDKQSLALILNLAERKKIDKNLDLIKKVFNISINAKNSGGYSILIKIILKDIDKGAINKIRGLLELGVDPNLRTNDVQQL